MLSRTDLQRYIKLARSFKPKITPEARASLIHKYRQLRSADRAGIRGAFGVTVRQLESLIRLSEAVARIHLDEKVQVEYVHDAYELMNSTLRRVERQDIELNEEIEPQQVSEEPAAGDPDAAARGRPRRMKISYDEYQRIGKMLARHLWEQEQDSVSVTEEDLYTWYMEQIEAEIETEAQLYEQQHLVQAIIERIVSKDRVLVEYMTSPDPARPELRVLVKHRNFIVGNSEVSGRHDEEGKGAGRGRARARNGGVPRTAPTSVAQVPVAAVAAALDE